MFGINKRIIISRTIGDRAQIGDLGQVQLVRRLVKIALRRGSDPVIAVHEIDIVEIELKDLVLIIFLLKGPGDKDLLDLSLPGSAVVEEDSPGQLHCDRTSALSDLSAKNKLSGGTNDRLIIDTVMLIIALVLYTDDRLFEKVRDL